MVKGESEREDEIKGGRRKRGVKEGYEVGGKGN